MQVELKTVIKNGHLELSVPDGMEAHEALKMYSGNYPELAFANLSEPVIDGEKRVYTVIKEKSVGTKG